MPSLQSFVTPSIGPIFVIPGTPLGSASIAFTVPPILTLPSVSNAVITLLTLTFQPGYLDHPPDCPAAGWDWIFDFTYEGGEVSSDTGQRRLHRCSESSSVREPESSQGVQSRAREAW